MKSAKFGPDNTNGVIGFYAMAFMGMVPFGSLLAGSLADMIGAPNALVVGGIACILGSVLFARKLATLREMARPIYIEKGILAQSCREDCKKCSIILLWGS